MLNKSQPSPPRPNQPTPPIPPTHPTNPPRNPKPHPNHQLQKPPLLPPHNAHRPQIAHIRLPRPPARLKDDPAYVGVEEPEVRVVGVEGRVGVSVVRAVGAGPPRYCAFECAGGCGGE